MNQRYEISVENIKCDGCASTIVKKVSVVDGVINTEVDVEAGVVKVDGTEGLLEIITSTLMRLGYPEPGTTKGIAASRAKAKSFVSCAIGKINN